MSSTNGRRVLTLGAIVVLGAAALTVAAVFAPHPSDCPAYIGSAPDCGSFGPIAFLSGAVLAIGGVVLILMGLAVRRDDSAHWTPCLPLMAREFVDERTVASSPDSVTA